MEMAEIRYAVFDIRYSIKGRGFQIEKNTKTRSRKSVGMISHSASTLRG
jgi:hypothetical protein